MSVIHTNHLFLTSEPFSVCKGEVSCKWFTISRTVRVLTQKQGKTRRNTKEIEDRKNEKKKMGEKRIGRLRSGGEIVQL